MLVDSLSKFVNLEPLPDERAESVVRCLMKFVSRGGQLHLLVSDRGTQYTSELMAAWLDANRALQHLHVTGVYRNKGIAESRNHVVRKTLKRALYEICLDETE